jgi:Ankyrin repeats (3 copies)
MNQIDQKAIRYSVFLNALKGDPQALATALSKLEGTLDFQIEPDSQTPLDAAVEHGNAKAVAVLLDCGADPHKTTATNHTTLMTAAWKGATETARLLLEAGVNPRLRRQDGATALDLALRMGHEPMVKLLAPLSPAAWGPEDRAKLETEFPGLFAPVVSLLDRAGTNGDSGETCEIPTDWKSGFEGEWYLEILEIVPLAKLRFVFDSGNGFDHICRFLTIREMTLEELPRSEFGHFPPLFPHHLVRDAQLLPIAINAYSDIIALALPERQDSQVVLCSGSQDGEMELEEVANNLQEFLSKVRPVSEIRSNVSFPEDNY